MPYTLMKGLGWFALALVLGIVIGWLLRSVVAKRQVARARNHHVDSVEMERLRGRVANLEPIVSERDQLRQELDAAVRARSKGAEMVPPPRFNTVADGLAPAAAVTDAPDLSVAAAVLGRSIDVDDLQVVEGIGPKIAELCHGIGIRTWRDLADTEVSLLRTMLADAGPRFRTHDPATWPEQGRLLAEGRWGEFKALVDALDGGSAAAVTDAGADAATTE
jgi:predicted flap endonuclease-1-like 5' DNA nuclease